MNALHSLRSTSGESLTSQNLDEINLVPVGEINLVPVGDRILHIHIYRIYKALRI